VGDQSSTRRGDAPRALRGGKQTSGRSKGGTRSSASRSEPEPFFDISIASGVVETITETETAIVRVEGFRIDGAGRPQSEANWIADIWVETPDWSACRDACNAAALAFLGWLQEQGADVFKISAVGKPN
jgi:hypothetical protein